MGFYETFMKQPCSCRLQICQNKVNMNGKNDAVPGQVLTRQFFCVYCSVSAFFLSIPVYTMSDETQWQIDRLTQDEWVSVFVASIISSITMNKLPYLKEAQGRFLYD